MQVYLNEYNIRMERAAYLPIASGLLRAYAETQPDLKANYQFQPFNYHMDAAANIMARYQEPAVAGFSVSMWNERLNLAVAAEVKRRWPDCLIVFGGPQVPQHPQDYFNRYPFVDVAVRAEGEEAFSKILARNLESRDFTGIPGIAWRRGHECVRNEENSHQPKDLDMYPSPYLEGLFDPIMQSNEYEMQAIIETNRGCPFPCSFCYWGQGGLSRKYRFHGVERVKLEIEWAAKNKIKYLFNADSNFGMHKRDEEIATILIDTKREYGFPEKFRTCFGKNADERIYDIASRLHDVELEKGITLALQSNNATVLKNINRQNIKMSAYQSLQRKFNARGVPVYSELILGMPGETLDTWKEGIEDLLQAGLKNQLFVYLCQVLPNTEMSEIPYQLNHGMKLLRIELNEIHGAVRSDDLTTEYEDIIVGTAVMDEAMWKRMVLFSWVTMVLHSMKVGFFVMLYLHKQMGRRYTDFIEFACSWDGPLWSRELREFDEQIARLLAGQGRGRIMPGYAPIYWDEEEASFLRISENADAFYAEFRQMAEAFAGCDLGEVVQYQRMRIPPIAETSYTFKQNLPEYFDKVMTEEVTLTDAPQTMRVFAKSNADKAQFAKETILWGRKSGTMLTKYETS